MRFIKNHVQRSANKERRQFLNMVAKAGVSTALLKASPLVMSVFAARHAEALTTQQKKAVFWYQPDGSPPDFWLPSGGQMNTATTPYGEGNAADGITGYNVAQYCRFYELSNVFSEHGRIYRALGHSLDAHQIINTVDTQIAKSNGFTSNFSILRASAHKTQGEGGFSVENGAVSTFTEGAKEVFNLVFNGASVDSSDSTYKTVFEMNAAALSTIERKLGAEEKSRMEEHLTALQKIQSNLESASDDTPDDACQVQAVSANPSDIVEHGMLLADVVLAALRCGLTNVASIMMSDTQCGWGLGPAARELMNITSGISDNNFHSANHGGTSEEKRRDQGRMLAYLSQVPAYFISELAKQTDATGMPLIESTLFVQLSEMGYGANHTPDGAPWILASGSEFRSRFGSYGNNTALCRDIPNIMDVRGKSMGELDI